MAAAVCRRGHTISSDVNIKDSVAKCPTCGASVLTACASCGHRVQGRYKVESVASVSGFYTPPDSCDSCGAPHPWASRQARLWELENLLDDNPDLSEADRLVISEQLQALSNPDLSEDEQVERWQKVKDLAPALFKSSARIVETVTTAFVMKKLGLD